jgi:hypothetical protein
MTPTPPPTPPGTLSPDGQYRWDGTAWQSAQAAPPPPGAPPAQVAQKKGHMARNLGIGCLGLIVLIVIIVAATSAGKNTNTTSTPAASSAPAAQKVLLDLTGSGSKTTAKFNAAGDWDLTWSYDCSAFAGGSGNFQVFVYSGDGSLSSNSPVNQLGKSGNGVENYHSGGQLYLTMNSECTWHVTAKG